jgi:hypothetical protein
MGKGLALMAGIGYGLGMMYLLDPDLGRRRRALVRGQMTHVRNHARRWLRHQLRNGFNHLRGSVSELRARMREIQVDDEILRERVRARIGHVVANPGSLDIVCHNGGVLVRGPLVEGEREKIEQRLSHTRGVRYWSMEVREVGDEAAASEQKGVSRWRERIG